MITRCDHCGSTFEVSAELVYSNDPQVRCGECMSLFDARANLYNAAEDSRSADQALKPVNKDRLIKKAQPVVDLDYLETADTVAVEHLYTSNGVTSTGSGVSHAGADIAAVAQPDGGFDSDALTTPPYQSSGRSAGDADAEARDPVAYSKDHYPSDFEFERTVSTETPLQQGLNSGESSGESIYGSDSSAVDYLNDDTASSSEDHRRHLREREQRALQLEPDRSFESLDGDDIPLDGSAHPEELARAEIERARQVSQRKLSEAESSAPRNRQASVSRSDVIRNAGRDLQDSYQHKRDSKSLLHAAHTSANGSYDEQPAQPQVAQDSAHLDNLHNSEFDHMREAEKLSTASPRQHDRPEYAEQKQFRPEPTKVSESSAQEMRRYQRYRPAIEVAAMEDASMPEPVLEQDASPVVHRRSSAGTVFWLAGLTLAIGLLLFAARGVIANMNLPEPFITAFCQVTGCVPAQPRKDVDQLQTMRQQLYSHPNLENALVISVDVVNNSVFKQPLPTLEVQLLNAENQSVARRDFSSADYEVVDGSSEAGYLMPDEPTRIMIEVVDTGLSASEVDLTYR